jgi:hypothetical protein
LRHHSHHQHHQHHQQHQGIHLSHRRLFRLHGCRPVHLLLGRPTFLLQFAICSHAACSWPYLLFLINYVFIFMYRRWSSACPRQEAVKGE